MFLPTPPPNEPPARDRTKWRLRLVVAIPALIAAVCLGNATKRWRQESAERRRLADGFSFKHREQTLSKRLALIRAAPASITYRSEHLDNFRDELPMSVKLGEDGFWLPKRIIRFQMFSDFDQITVWLLKPNWGLQLIRPPIE